MSATSLHQPASGSPCWALQQRQKNSRHRSPCRKQAKLQKHPRRRRPFKCHA